MMVVVAFLLDQLLADPPHWPHPVRLMGRLISELEKHLYDTYASSKKQLLHGVVLVLIVLVVTYGTVWGVLQFLSGIHPGLEYAFAVYLLFTSISAKGLKLAAVEVLDPLERKELPEARKKLSYIVGRDTEGLREESIARAVVETVAENFSDGVVAPLFFFLLGGVPLAMLYKAINTMDSMVGYQNDRYQYFGRVAAKLDDVANWIPARLSVFFIILAGAITGNDWQQGIRTARLDGRNHKSPNAGWPEAAMAGTLGVQLGGTNMYFGKPVVKPTIGQPSKPVDGNMIKQSLELLKWATGTAVVAALVITTIMGG